MAKPIKITPVLRGQNAINFFNRLEENRTKVVSKEYLSNIRDLAKQLQSLSRTK